MPRLSEKDYEYMRSKKSGNTYNLAWAKAKRMGYNTKQSYAYADSIIKMKTGTGTKLYKPKRRRVRRNAFGFGRVPNFW